MIDANWKQLIRARKLTPMQIIISGSSRTRPVDTSQQQSNDPYIIMELWRGDTTADQIRRDLLTRYGKMSCDDCYVPGSMPGN